jgi:hypothetical protein
MEVSGQLHAPAALSPCNPWIGGWLSHRTGLDDVEKRKFLSLPRLEPGPVGHSARRYTDCVTPDLLEE